MTSCECESWPHNGGIGEQEVPELCAQLNEEWSTRASLHIRAGEWDAICFLVRKRQMDLGDNSVSGRIG